MNCENNPILIEPGVKSFISTTLKGCSTIKETYTNFLFNFCMTVLFIILLSGLLLYKYKGKLTPVEIETKNKEKQQYILEKIKGFQIAKQKAQQELITGLPHWENEYNIINSRPNI